MRVLVTGASGFCGYHLCQYLNQRGYDVTGTFHAKAKAIPTGSLKRLIRLDINCFEQVCDLVKRERPDGIFHLAAISVPRLSWRDPDLTFAVNAGGTIHVLEAVRRFMPETRVLFASSAQVYGHTYRHRRDVEETNLLWPDSPYGASKAVAEFACLDYHQRFGLDVVIARAVNHLGFGLTRQLVMADWCQQIAEAEEGLKEPVLEVGNIRLRREFLHVRDVVRAYEILMRRGKPGAVYNVASGRPRPLREYAQRLLKQSRIKMRIKVLKSKMRRHDPLRVSCNALKLRAMGWKPEESAFDALEDVIRQWREKVISHG